jgi:ribosomal protein L37E
MNKKFHLVCPRCGKVIEYSNPKFCPFCNFEMPQHKPEFQYVVVKSEFQYIVVKECPKCHKAYKKGEVYCCDCGEKLVELKAKE